jgi:DNA-binding SARP family transcriptional activator
MLSVRLFGKLSVLNNGRELDRLPSGKPVELFCYLLLQRERLHSREVLASLLWGDCTTAQSKKYLRQALWQIHGMIQSEAHPEPVPVLVADRESVRVNPKSEMWLDVAAFETACVQLRDVPRQGMSPTSAEILNRAVELYRGDLLEGWYQDWCLFERERLRNLYLVILEKLMSYSEDQKQYEAGLEFGERILRLERAHELTYQAMMRLHNLAGDRAGAIRQYQRCSAALQEELGVKPGRHTMQLLDQIRGDCVPSLPTPQPGTPPVMAHEAEPSALLLILAHLRQLLSVLNDAQGRIEIELQAVDAIAPAPTPISPKGTVQPILKTPHRTAS